jgi:Ser/Thr protein kinase RdoA (MazF antagonist)
METAFPTSAEGLTLGVLDALVKTMHPGVSVTDFAVLDTWLFEEGDGQVSTAGRIAVEVTYGVSAGTDLPQRLILKVNRPALAAHPLYRNEVAVYTRLRAELGSDVETPRCVGAAFDDATDTFAIALEDLSVAGARFSNVTTPITVQQLQSLLSSLAVLHGKYWDSPRFEDELSWVQPHIAGELHELFFRLVPALIQHEVDTVQFKRELVEMVGQTAASLEAQTKKVQAHQATLPRTLCHGDAHIGNTYLIKDRGGFVDWQLTAHGHHMHDVHYLIITALSVEQRRAHERDLLRYYLDQLARTGVAITPDFETAWLEYRRAAVWGLYIGWLTTPVENYGWDITVNNHIRLASAYQDLETAQAIAEID